MPKDKFKALDKDFRDAVANMTDETDIRGAIAKISLNQVELMKAKELDQDLIQKRQAASFAGEVYRDGTKFNKLRVELLHQRLGELGKDTGSFDAEKVEEEADDARERAEDEAQ